MEALMRQWTMLKLIPRFPAKKTTSRLRDELEEAGYPTTLRTVQRDLEKIAPDFQIITDGHKPAGWSWSRAAHQFDIPGMTSHAALVFKMVERHLVHMLPKTCLDLLLPYFRQAGNILEELHPRGMAAWPHKVAVLPRGMALQAPAIDSDVLFSVYEGLLFDRQLRIMYRRRGEDDAQERVVNPLGLVVVDQVHYLVGSFWHYTDVLHLAIHRIESAKVLDESAIHPEDFDLQAYAASGEFGYPEGEGTIKLKALFDSYTAEKFRETPLSAGQKLTVKRDGRVLVQAEVQDTAQLRWWLLGFGEQVEVLGPKWLRAEIFESCRNVMKLYSSLPKKKYICKFQ